MAKTVKKTTRSENRKLLSHIEEGMKRTHEALGSLYLSSDETTADLIHGIRKEVYYLRGIFFDLLFDECSAKEILEERK